MSRGQTVPPPPTQAASPSSLLWQELKPKLAAWGGCTGPLCAMGASSSPALVLPVLGAQHSGSQPLTLHPPAPELPGAAQRGAGTSHLRVPEQQQEEEGGGEGLRYRLREPGEGGWGGLGHPRPPALQGAEQSCPHLWHFPGRSKGSPSPSGSNRPLHFRAAMRTKAKTTWWWMRSVCWGAGGGRWGWHVLPVPLPELGANGLLQAEAGSMGRWLWDPRVVLTGPRSWQR